MIVIYWRLKKPDVYAVSIGNLTVGGTGKTPMVEFLIKRSLASGSFRAGEVATLSRGYGRKTTGFRMATPADTADTLGDEPLQLYRKFNPAVRVCVGERRVEAVKSLLEVHPDVKKVLLDDAFQHRSLPSPLRYPADGLQPTRLYRLPVSCRSASRTAQRGTPGRWYRCDQMPAQSVACRTGADHCPNSAVCPPRNARFFCQSGLWLTHLLCHGSGRIDPEPR